MALVAMGCDLATFALDPKPRFDETWNLPAPSTKISVADLLPSGGIVSIYSTPASNPPDSSAFRLTISPASISVGVGANCAPCLPLNGTNAIKPPFTLAASNSTPLPTDVVSAAILSGSLVVSLTNNMSFDPLFVKTGVGAQGFMVIVVRSGSLVLGRDSVQGAATPVGPNQTTWAPAPAAGSVLTRAISLSSGTVVTSLTVDVTIDSPVGDHLVLINTSGQMNATATANNILVGSVSMNVTNKSMNSGGADSVNLTDVTGDAIQSLGLQMTFINPFAVTGSLTVKLAYGPGVTQNITKAITLPSGNGQRSITLNAVEIQSLLGKTSSLSFTGSVNSVAPIAVTPKQAVSIDNRIVVAVRTSSGGK